MAIPTRKPILEVATSVVSLQCQRAVPGRLVRLGGDAQSRVDTACRPHPFAEIPGLRAAAVDDARHLLWVDHHFPRSHAFQHSDCRFLSVDAELVRLYLMVSGMSCPTCPVFPAGFRGQHPDVFRELVGWS